MDNKPEICEDTQHLIGDDKFDNVGKKAPKKRKRKQKVVMITLFAIVVVAATGGIVAFVGTREKNTENNNFAKMNGGRFDSDKGILTATGTTSIGIDTVTFDIDFLEDTSLYVEEVYLKTGDIVEAGTKYLKFTEDSIQQAREELEEAAQSADLLYRSSVITTNESKIQEKYTYQQTLLTATQSEAVYNETVAELQAKLDAAQNELDEATQEYNKLYNQIADNTFYADYEVAEKKAAYEDAYDLYVTKMSDWEMTEDDLESVSMSNNSMDSNAMNDSLENSDSSDRVSFDESVALYSTDDETTDSDNKTSDDEISDDETSDDDENSADDENSGNETDKTDSDDFNKDRFGEEDKKNVSGMGFGSRVSSEDTEKKWIIKALKLMKEEAEEAEKEYEQALEEYEDAIENAELNLKTLGNALELAQEEYTQAQLDFQKESLSAKTTYEMAAAKSKTAQNDYDTQLTSLQETLDKLKDSQKEAKSNLELFEELIGDGYFYTPNAGTVLMIRAEAGQTLSGNDIILAYSNTEEITVSVSVSQEYISQITVGDEATIYVSNYGNYEGKVKQINPISSSDSRTSVNYTVELVLEGDVSELSANLTANVVFGDNQEIPMSDGQNGEKPEMPMSDGQNGEKPEIPMSDGQNGEKPEISISDGQNGEKPDMSQGRSSKENNE